MKAITHSRYGSAEVLELRDIDSSTASDHDSWSGCVRPGSRGVLHVMIGEPYLMRLIGFGVVKPKNAVLGMDVAGTVTDSGAGVARFKLGDEVFGIAKRSYAEYAAASEDKPALKPKSLTFEQAAAMASPG